MKVWRLAWRSAFRRRRLFVWNIAVPMLLLTPVALSAAAAPHRVAVFGVFLVFFASFGSAIPAVRDGQDGWLDQVFRTGYGARRWLGERALAEAAIDLLQTAPAVLILLWSAGGLSQIGKVFLALAGTLLFANIIGPAIAMPIHRGRDKIRAGGRKPSHCRKVRMVCNRVRGSGSARSKSRRAS